MNPLNTICILDGLVQDASPLVCHAASLGDVLRLEVAGRVRRKG